MKIIKTLLVMLLALSVAACSNSSENGGTVAGNKEETISIPFISEEVKMFPKEASIEETTLYDQDGLVIIAKEIDYSYFSPQYVLEFQNNTDAEYQFLAGTLGHCANAINGYMIQSGYINVTVAPGTAETEKVTINADMLKLLGITEIGEIIMDIEIEDTDSKSTYTGPLSVKTSEYENIDMTPAFAKAIKNKTIIDKAEYKIKYMAEDVLFDECDVKMVSEVLVRNASDEDALLLEFKNDLGKDCYISIENIGINGMTVSSGRWTSDYVYDGKSVVMSINLSYVVDTFEREAFGLDDYGVISFDVSVYDKSFKEAAVEGKLVEVTVGKGSKLDTSGDTLYDNNGIVVISKGLYDDDSEYSNDVHWIMMVTNNTDKTIRVEDEYHSQFINGNKVEYSYMSSQYVEPGKSCILDMVLSEYDFKNLNISSKDDIKSVSTKLVIRDSHYDTIDSSEISLNFGE